MHYKKEQRVRRSKKLRAKAAELRATRLCVNRSSNHMYAQIIDPDNKVLASASTNEKDVKAKVKATGNVKAAEFIGELVAERALKAKVEQVTFDRSGFKYHGRVKALAEAARKKGLKF